MSQDPKTFHLDANRINAKQDDPWMNQLEELHRCGFIFLEMPRTAYREAEYGDERREEKAAGYTWVEINDSLGGEDEFRRQIELAAFPSGAKTRDDQNDVEILLASKMAVAPLITRDGASKSQPRGILGSAHALAKLGIRVLSAKDALNEITKLLGASLLNKKYEVTMWIESDGEPEDDPCISKVVVAPNKHAALDWARLLVRDENPEVNHLKIWAWSV